MSKIITAMNVMIENHERIGGVIYHEDDAEFFFIYDNKFVWAIKKFNNGDFRLTFFPETKNVSNIASELLSNWKNTDVTNVQYFSDELAPREARETFMDLYRTVNEKAFGMDKVFDAIIGKS